MARGANEDPQSVLRPLRAAGGVLASLRSGAISQEERTGAVIRVAEAVEMTLRRLLRDHDAAALEVRLRALDPDDLHVDEVISELRQHERISMELAAGVHDLARARQRLLAGGVATAEDATAAARTADRLEHEVAERIHFPRPAVTPAVMEPAPVDETLVQPVPVETPGRAWLRDRRVLAGAGALLLLLLVLGVWRFFPRGPSEMDQGVALFRSGRFQDAAPHFWRYAQQNPEDPTPHLYLARIHRRLRRYDLAAPELSRALALAPDDPDVKTESAFLALDTGRYDTAIQGFRDVLRVRPDAREAWVGLVVALQASGRPDVAQRAAASAPPEVRALLAERARAARPAAPDTLP